jgi:hypothetical protein
LRRLISPIDLTLFCSALRGNDSLVESTSFGMSAENMAIIEEKACTSLRFAGIMRSLGRRWRLARR